jgi:steroid 5-alpha reductase family enzyme
MSSKNLSHLRLILFFTAIIFLLSLITPDTEIQILNINILQFVLLYVWLVQVVAFIFAFIYQTEKYYDFIGSLTYSSSTLIVYFSLPTKTQTDNILLILVLIWSLRLGLFLFRRIIEDGHDTRFDKPKQSFFHFLQFWTGQAMWVSFTCIAVYVAMISEEAKTLSIISLIGLFLWIAGFTIEVIADGQKRNFRKESNNKGRYISTGLWSRSRHPNYFGEITLWVGVSVITLSSLSGVGYVALISPLFVYALLSKGSGIPLLERSADKRWGEELEYQEYKKKTPVLFPKLFKNVEESDSNSN